MTGLVESVPKLHSLPVSLPRGNAVEIDVEEGVLIFRVSEVAQEKIEELLEKQKSFELDDAEETELDRYEEIDDYLSFLNRLTRNLAHNQDEELNGGS